MVYRQKFGIQPQPGEDHRTDDHPVTTIGVAHWVDRLESRPLMTSQPAFGTRATDGTVGLVGSVSFSIPERLAADLVREQHLKVAVETGTNTGIGTRKLAVIAERVVSIELSQDLYRAAQQSLADLPNVASPTGFVGQRAPRRRSGLTLSQPSTGWMATGARVAQAKVHSALFLRRSELSTLGILRRSPAS